MNKFLILTSNLGEKDILKDPIEKFDNCDYFAFVDKNHDVKIWEQKNIFDFTSIDKYKHRRNAKVYKVLSSILFPEYEYIIWHDANHNLIINPSSILEEYGDKFDLLLFKHADRNCIYQEMSVVKAWNFEEPKTIDDQFNYYHNIQKMPQNISLFEMNCFIKQNNHQVKTLDLMWWEQICKFSSRDQCSFTYCLWKLNDILKIKTFKGVSHKKQGGNIYFSEHEHLH